MMSTRLAAGATQYAFQRLSIGTSPISLLFNWFRYLYQNKRITEADFEQLSQVYYDEGEVSMLIQSIRKEHRIREAERRQFAQQIQQERLAGKLEGRSEGILEGELRGKLEIARSMLREGLDIDFIMKMTQLSREEIDKINFFQPPQCS